MQFLSSLFGGSGNSVLGAVFALGIVLVLIVLGLWVLKVAFRATGTVTRGRGRRLSIVEALPVDQKRQLVIVRRDGVEHLILTGGGQDLLVETGIPVQAPQPAQTGQRGTPPTEQPAKPAKTEVGTSATPELPAFVGAPKGAPKDRLRDIGKSAALRKGPSLRQTGLLRSSGDSSHVKLPTPEIPQPPQVDSARTSPFGEQSEQDRLDGSATAAVEGRTETH